LSSPEENFFSVKVLDGDDSSLLANILLRLVSSVHLGLDLNSVYGARHFYSTLSQVSVLDKTFYSPEENFFSVKVLNGDDNSLLADILLHSVPPLQLGLDLNSVSRARWFRSTPH
jgi:hypothetical protein